MTEQPNATCESLAGTELCTIDMTYTLQLDQDDFQQCTAIWDHAHVLAGLQGIVNRNAASIYQLFVGENTAGIDKFWLNWMRSKDNWLSARPIQSVATLQDLIMLNRHYLRGVVAYDPSVCATSNVASTVAGVEDLLPIRFDSNRGSLFHWLTQSDDGPRLPVKVWLVNKDGSSRFTGQGVIPDTTMTSSGSAKCDAYLWAKSHYLDTGRCNPLKMGYYIDAYWLKNPEGYVPNHTLSNHDYFIANRGFFFDLSPWTDETPVDDTNQPLGTDQRTLQAILRSAWNQTGGLEMIHIGGFPPWNKKYTDIPGVGGKHGCVATEWHYAYIASCFNAYMDADALGLGAMANASVFQHFPLRPHYPQNFPSVADLQEHHYVKADGGVADKSYFTFYVGDYDSAAWMYQNLPEMWPDPARGSIPLGWAFNPNLSDRFAPGMAYVRMNKSTNDYFVSGDSGAGYLNPGALQEPREYSGLPSGMKTWTKHCMKYYDLWDIKLTAFVIDGDAPPMDAQMRKAYAQFSPAGVVALKTPPLEVYDGTPFLRMTDDLPNEPEKAAKIILDQTSSGGCQFRIYRTILRTPSWHKQVFDAIARSNLAEYIELVDPYLLMLLVKMAKSA